MITKILIEATAAIDAAGTEQTFYLSNERFVTEPSDTPPHQDFLPCVIDPGFIGTHCFSDGKTSGVSKLENGEVVLANLNGQFDNFANYSFDGRAIVIRAGDSGAYPGSFTAVFTGTVAGVQLSEEFVIFKLKDKSFVLQTPVLTASYAGDNVLPDGLEGTPTDLKGKLKPRVFGTVFSVAPPLVNTSKLTYQVNDGAVDSIPDVYDRGLALTPGTDYATSTLLQAATPTASTFDTCIAEGYFRLGSSPAGQITADVVEGATSADRTVAQLLNQFGTIAGLSSGEISASDVAALDVANSAEVGIWLNNETTTSESAMDQIAASIGAWYGFDTFGVLRMAQLTAPTGSPIVTLQEYETIGAMERRVPADNGIPSYSVTIRHTKVWTVQTSDLAGAVDAAMRAYLAEEYRAAKDENLSILTQWLLSQPLTFDGLLTTEADAVAEAERRNAIYTVRWDIFDVPISIDVLAEHNFKLMDEIGLVRGRFGLDAGKSFMLIGIRLQLATGTAILSLWGGVEINSFMLLEDGYSLLLESGSKLILE